MASQEPRGRRAARAHRGVFSRKLPALPVQGGVKHTARYSQTKEGSRCGAEERMLGEKVVWGGEKMDPV